LSGTVSYASPEQCQSRAVDHRSDVYSLGVVLYEMLTGERPFTGRTPTEIALKQIQIEPRPLRQLNPEISSNLEKTVLRALAKSPDERQQSIMELAEELSRSTHQFFVPLNDETPVESYSDADGYGESEIEESSDVEADRLTLVRRRRRRVALAAAALVLAMIGTGAILGKNWLSSKVVAPMMAEYESLKGTPSASPDGKQEAVASDPDSLELAAQLSPDHAAAIAAHKQQMQNGSAQPKPVNTQTAASPGNAAGNYSAKNASASKTVLTPAPKQSSSQAQPKPTPAPVIAASRPPQSAQKQASRPEAVQPPVKNNGSGAAGRENSGPQANTNDDFNRTTAPPAASRDRIVANRNRNDDAEDDRRYSNSQRQ